MAELQQSSADDRMMTETYKDSVYATLRAGEIFAEQGKLIRASDAYKSALMAKSPPPPCAHAGYGIVLLRQKEVSKASSEFAEELKLNPGCGLARLGLAALSLIQGDTDRAQKEVATLWHTDRGFLQESLPLLRDVLSEDQYGQLLHIAEDLEAHGDNPPAESADVLHTGSQAVSQELKEAEAFYLSGQYQKCSDSLRPPERFDRTISLTFDALRLLHGRLQDGFVSSAKAQINRCNPRERALLGEQGRSEVSSYGANSRW